MRQLDGSYGRVEVVAVEARAQRMYNLTVAVAHTFFVGDGQWLVHNTCNPYEVGRYDALTSKSLPGDNLEIHHVPQKHPASQVISGYNPDTGTSIALPMGEHRAIPTLRGTYTGTARQLLATDLRNLRRYTNAPASAIRELRDLIYDTYPGAFKK